MINMIISQSWLHVQCIVGPSVIWIFMELSIGFIFFLLISNTCMYTSECQMWKISFLIGINNSWLGRFTRRYQSLPWTGTRQKCRVLERYHYHCQWWALPVEETGFKPERYKYVSLQSCFLTLVINNFIYSHACNWHKEKFSKLQELFGSVLLTMVYFWQIKFSKET